MTVFSASFAPPEFFAGWGCSTIVRRKVLEKTDLNCVKNWCIAACSTQPPTRRFQDFSLKRLCVTKRCRATKLVGDMDWSDGGGLQMGVEINMRELQDADAIVSLANDAGQISICGFGSLLSGSLDFSLHFHSPLALFFLGVCSSDFFLLLAIVCQSL
jgi:hypothetical protein